MDILCPLTSGYDFFFLQGTRNESFFYFDIQRQSRRRLRSQMLDTSVIPTHKTRFNISFCPLICLQPIRVRFHNLFLVSISFDFIINRQPMNVKHYVEIIFSNHELTYWCDSFRNNSYHQTKNPIKYSLFYSFL